MNPKELHFEKYKRLTAAAKRMNAIGFYGRWKVMDNRLVWAKNDLFNGKITIQICHSRTILSDSRKLQPIADIVCTVISQLNLTGTRCFYNMEVVCSKHNLSIRSCNSEYVRFRFDFPLNRKIFDQHWFGPFREGNRNVYIGQSTLNLFPEDEILDRIRTTCRVIKKRVFDALYT